MREGAATGTIYRETENTLNAFEGKSLIYRAFLDGADGFDDVIIAVGWAIVF